MPASPPTLVQQHLPAACQPCLTGSLPYHDCCTCRRSPFKSEWGQDKYLAGHLFNGRQHGTFLEAGCLDGVQGSNTFYFESKRKWKGVCVEPNTDLALKARGNRQALVLNALICDAPGAQNYTRFAPPYQSYNGIWSFMPAWKRQNILDLISMGKTQILSSSPVPCMTLLQVLDRFGQRHLDLLSLDVEGAEYSVLKQIDNDRIQIDVILYEGADNRIVRHLSQLGYFRQAMLKHDQVWVRKGSQVHKQLTAQSPRWEQPRLRRSQDAARRHLRRGSDTQH
jgi:FkbM family methyltransferase